MYNRKIEEYKVTEREIKLVNRLLKKYNSNYTFESLTKEIEEVYKSLLDDFYFYENAYRNRNNITYIGDKNSISIKDIEERFQKKPKECLYTFLYRYNSIIDGVIRVHKYAFRYYEPKEYHYDSELQEEAHKILLRYKWAIEEVSRNKEKLEDTLRQSLWLTKEENLFYSIEEKKISERRRKLNHRKYHTETVAFKEGGIYTDAMSDSDIVNEIFRNGMIGGVSI